MKYDVKLLDTAADNLSFLTADLLQRSPATVGSLESELADLRQQLITFPFAYQATEEPKVRRAVLRSCRYMLYSEVVGATVELIAILPQMAGPEWQSRRDVSGAA